MNSSIKYLKMRWLSKANAALFVGVLLFTTYGISQTIDRIEPPHWWVGMANPELQLMIHGENIGQLIAETSDKNVKVVSTETTDNPNYLFVNLDLTNAKATEVELVFTSKDGKKIKEKYQLKARKPGSAQREAFNPSDVIYLITPDRFANGDLKNDSVPEMVEGINRAYEGGRHGGDIKGITEHLDYMDAMGFTAVWSCPVIENREDRYSYHGYSTTDFYRVDPRMGTLQDYKTLSDEAKKRGMKLIMDQIMNHMGDGHWWMQDHPSTDWINNNWEYKWNSHYRSTLHDPHHAEIDKLSFTDGWFVESMPDLNQRNPLLAKYLIQNSIWWVEEADLDGIRMDTHPYPDKDFMADWSCAIMTEYPNFNIVGEEWTLNPAYIASWQKGNWKGYPSCMPSMMDFPVQKALVDALTEEESWWGGWFKLYEAVAQDFQYADPGNLVIYPDNHDMDRFYRQIDSNLANYKLGMAFMATTRGIPQIYYGTEILFYNKVKDDHGWIREDFPGGWPGDKVNAFTGVGLTADQKEAQDFTKALLNWRKNSEIVHAGQLIHFGPRDGVYVYFRYLGDKKVMVILNKNKEAYSLKVDRFQEIMKGANSGLEVLTNKKLAWTDAIELTPNSPMIIELN